jgi:hypothetical protein
MIRFKNLEILGEKHYISYKKFNDQVLAVYLGPIYEDNKNIEYNFGIAMADSKKQAKQWYIDDIDTRGLVTGRQGLEPLYWIYDNISEIESFLLNKHPDKKIKMSVAGDNRKFKIYKRFLTKKGYITDGPTLIKEINRGD